MAQETELPVVGELQELQSELQTEPPVEEVPEDSFSIGNSYARLRQLNEDVSAMRLSLDNMSVQTAPLASDYSGYFESILSALDRMEQKMLTSEDLAKGFKVEVLEEESSSPTIQPAVEPTVPPVTEAVTESTTEGLTESLTETGTETEVETETEIDPYLATLEVINDRLATSNNLGIGILIGVALVFGAVCALIFSSYVKH